MPHEFPKGFIFGVATASYQIEGAYDTDGRGESIWDRFSKTPGKVVNGDTGDVACDHYHRYKEDVAILQGLGVDSYRFSLSWPRILPEGKGKINHKGLDFYKRVLDALESASIVPSVTLYHWDLPQALQDKGGWANRDTAHYFLDYANIVIEELGPRVPFFATHNEPWCAAFLGYGTGHHAPGIQDPQQSITAAHHLLYSHGLVVQRYRELGQKGEIGIVLNPQPRHPKTNSKEDTRAAYREDGFLNRFYLDPLFKGTYPEDTIALLSTQNISIPIEAGDLATIATPMDFLGINYYSRAIVSQNPENPTESRYEEPEGPTTQMGWEIYPKGLYELLIRIQKDYGDIPLYITENGAAFVDTIDQGSIEDTKRRQYLEAHFEEAARAISAGVPLKGYYVWSLLDNFEWAFGYERRFGLVYVDFATQKRYLKDSAKWYREFIKKNRA